MERKKYLIDTNVATYYFQLQFTILISFDKPGNCYVITAYEPDIKIWKENFETKK